MRRDKRLGDMPVYIKQVVWGLLITSIEIKTTIIGNRNEKIELCQEN